MAARKSHMYTAVLSACLATREYRELNQQSSLTDQ